jgi:hypothetical protein
MTASAEGLVEVEGNYQAGVSFAPLSFQSPDQAPFQS